MKELKKGDTVEVFSDPLTCLQSEGKAKLLRPAHPGRDNDKIENWVVKFKSDGFEPINILKPLQK